MILDTLYRMIITPVIPEINKNYNKNYIEKDIHFSVGKYGIYVTGLEDYPIRYNLIQCLSKLEDLLYSLKKYKYNWFYYKFFDKYHIIDTKLKPGYHEVDTRLLHANFAILVDFVEIELKHALEIGFNKDEFKEVYELYYWWTIVRPNNIQKSEQMSDIFTNMGIDYIDNKLSEEDRTNYNNIIKEYSDFTEKLYDEDTEKLIELIKIRSRLWT